MPSFALRYPSPAAGSGSAFLEAYDRARLLGLAEDRTALQQALVARSLAREAAGERAVAATLGVEDEPIEMLPERTLAGRDIMAPPVQELTPQAAWGGPTPPSLALPARVVGRTPDVLEPAVTEPRATMRGVRRSLATDPAALAQLGSPEVERAAKVRGVLSEDELRYQQSLATADRDARQFRDDTRQALDQGDSLAFTVKQAAYYDRLATIFARTDAQGARRARDLHQQLLGVAVRLQEDKSERKLADRDTELMGQAFAHFNAKGGNTAENAGAIFAAFAGTKSKTWQTHFGNMAQQSLPKMIERIPDPDSQAFFTALMAAGVDQQRKGRHDFDLALQAATLQYPAAALRMLGDPGVLGQWARRVYFPDRRVSYTEVANAEREIEAEIAEGRLQGITVGSSDFYARVRAKVQERPATDARERERRAGSARREQRLGLKSELDAVKDDIRRLERERDSKNVTRDPAVIQEDINRLVTRRDALVGQIKAIQLPAGQRGDEDEEEGEVPPAGKQKAPTTGAPRSAAPAPGPSVATPRATPTKPLAGPLTGPALQARVAELAAAELKRRGKTAEDAKRDPALKQSVLEAVQRQLGAK